MREALERLVGSDVEDWTSLASRLRDDWRRDGVPMEARRDALLATFAELHREAHMSSRPQRSPRRHAVRSSEDPLALRNCGRAAPAGFVSLVGAGPRRSRAADEEGGAPARGSRSRALRRAGGAGDGRARAARAARFSSAAARDRKRRGRTRSSAR